MKRFSVIRLLAATTFFRVESPAERSAAPVTQRLLLGDHDGFTRLGVSGGVLGADVDGEDAQCGNFDAVLFNQVVDQHVVVALDEPINSSHGHVELFGEESK